MDKMLTKKKGVLITLGVVFVLMAIGSFADMPLSSAVYNPESGFGVFFAAAGQFPVMLCSWMGTALMLASLDKKAGILINGISVAAALAGLVVGVLALLQFRLYMPEYEQDSIIAQVVITVAVCAAVLLTFDVKDKALMRKIAFVLCLLPLASMYAFNAVKVLWGRPRWRAIAANDVLPFQPWWVIGSSAKETFMQSLALSSDEFKSFPSGHTSFAATIFSLLLLPRLYKKPGHMALIIGIIAAAFTAAVAASRIIVGAHFLTDVAAGFAVTYLLLIAMVKLLRIDNAKSPLA